MIECPRCGFVQPKDKYCANCGVDIENFHPAPKPLHQQMLGSPITYLVAFIIVVIATVAYLVSRPESPTGTGLRNLVYSPSDQDREADQLREQERNKRREEMEAQKLAAAQRIADEVAAQEQASAQAARTNRETEALKTAPVAAETKAEIPLPTKVAIKYFEFSQSSVGELIKRGQVINEGSDYQAIEIKTADPSKLFNELGGYLEPLPGGETKPLKAGGNHTLNFVEVSETGEFGLNLQLTVSTLAPQAVTLVLAGDIILKSPGESPPLSANLSGQLKISSGSSLVIIGFVPRAQAGKESTDERFSGTPLSILNSPLFTDPQSEQPTEFMMVFTPQP